MSTIRLPQGPVLVSDLIEATAAQAPDLRGYVTATVPNPEVQAVTQKIAALQAHAAEPQEIDALQEQVATPQEIEDIEALLAQSRALPGRIPDPHIPEPVLVSNREQAYGVHVLRFAKMVKRGELIPRNPLFLVPVEDFMPDQAGRCVVTWVEAQAFAAALGLVLEPEGATAAAIETQEEITGPQLDDAPAPLNTRQIAICFDGLRYTAEEWMKPLGDGARKWVKACRVSRGAQGGDMALWNPVLIGAALVDKCVNLNQVRARFQTKPMLKPWLDAWRTYEEDNLGTA